MIAAARAVRWSGSPGPSPTMTTSFQTRDCRVPWLDSVDCSATKGIQAGQVPTDYQGVHFVGPLVRKFAFKIGRVAQ